MKFRATMFRFPGAGGWTFALVPREFAPPATEPWGRAPVYAEVDGKAWETSIWHDRKRGPMLAVPKRIRGSKGDGDSIEVSLRPRSPQEEESEKERLAQWDPPTPRGRR